MATRTRRTAKGTELEPYRPDEDDTVDLGGVEDIDDGANLVSRRVNDRGEVGIPTMSDPESEPVADEDERRLRPLRSFVDALKGYRELRRTPYGYTPLLIIGFLTFFSVFEVEAYGISRPFIVRDLEVEVVSIIQIAQYVGVITLFAALYFGWYLDRHKRAPYVGLGAILGGIFGMFSSRAFSLAWLGTSRVGANVADEVGGVPRFSLLGDYYPPEARGRAFAFLGTLRRVAVLLSTAIVGVVIEWIGWRTAIVVFSIPVVLMGVVALVRLREPVRGYMERRALGATDQEAREEDEPQSFGEGWRTVFSIRTLRRQFIGDVFVGMAGGVSSLFALFFLVEEYHLSASQISFFFLPGVVTGLIAGIYGGSLVDRFTRRNPGRVLAVYGLFYFAAAIGVAGYILRPPIWVLVVFQSIVAAGTALVGPAAAAVYSQVIPPHVRTQGLQVTGLASLPTLIIGLPVANTLFTEYGYRSVFLFTIPLFIIGGILYLSAAPFFDLDVRAAFAASLADQEWRRARSSGKGKMLVCRDVDVDYDGVQVLFNVDFDVEEGEIIALLGTNGAGKSTLLKAISGTREASGGAIVFDGRDITHMPPHEIAARRVIHMPGGRGVFPGLSVRDNLMLANWLTEDPDEIRKGLDEIFEIFPVLRERADVDASTLSGGEQQQLSLAQAFLSKPRLLMIDELSLGLSPAVVGQLIDIVKEIHKRGVTIIVVEQSVNVALQLAEKAIFMEKGEVKFFGRTDELQARPDIVRAIYVKGTGALTDSAPSSAVRDERKARELGLVDARPVLEVEHLHKRFGGLTAVEEVSFALREGEVLGLIGPNGAGKTTVFEMISGFQIPDAGSVRYEGVDITSMAPEERARLGLVRRFQDARLFPPLTVFETLLVSLEQRLEVKNPLLHAIGAPRARRAEKRLRVRAERLVELLELGSYRDKFVKELSTGLRRVVDLACVLGAEPKVLLLDEPSSGIAQAEAEGLAPLLRRIRFETGCSILIIEHDMPLISAVSDELIALERGTVITRGKPEEVLNDERVIESYLGTSEAAVKRSGSLKSK